MNNNKAMIKNVSNKKIELLVDGKKAFSRIIKRIRSANDTIYINMFIWRDDKIGNIIAKELIDAADRGVKIHIIKDKLGEIFEKSEESKQSFFHKEFNFSIWYKSIAIDIMYPMKGKKSSRKQNSNNLSLRLIMHANTFIDKEIVRRDHSKYYIFDNEILIIGGMNIEDKTVYTDKEGKKYNDFMVELYGENLIETFMQRLNYGTSYNELSQIEFIFNIKRVNEKLFNVKYSLIDILSSAKESIDIIMAYIGDKDITDKIIESSLKGIKINIVMPSKANIQQDMNMKALKLIMKKTDNKVNVYLSKNMVHAKFIRIDNRIVTIGSTNLNTQAMKKLSELNILIRNYDHDFSYTVEETIRKQISYSKKVSNFSNIQFNYIKAMLEQIASNLF